MERGEELKLQKADRNRRVFSVAVFALAMVIAGACASRDRRPFEEIQEVDGLIAVVAERPDGTVERVRLVTERDTYVVHDSEKGPDLLQWPGRRALAQGRVYEVEGVKTIVVTEFELAK
jgi:hypothetical protein